MKVSQQQLQDLLELSAVDQLMTRSRNSVTALANNPELAAAEADWRDSGSDFIAANNAVESLKSELGRIEADLTVVEQRIARDKAALQASSNPKEVSGLEHEMATLARRKSELEDASLAVMEQLSELEDNAAAVKTKRSEIEATVSQLRQQLQAEHNKLVSGIELAAGDRARIAARLPHELLELYASKSKRGLPVGRLVSRECGACHMTITASAYADLTAAAVDEMVTCPECSAILVR